MRVCSEECGREATLFCAKCDADWCQQCSEKVHSMRAFKSHEPVAITDDEQQPQQPHASSEHERRSPPSGAATASSVAASLAGLSLEVVPASAHRWFSRSGPPPAAASPTVLIVVDWHSFVWVVRRTSLGMLVRTLAHLAHDLGRTTVTKLLFLMDSAPYSAPSHPEPSPRAKEVAAEMSAFFIEQMQLMWETTAGVDAAQQPPLLANKLAELIQRTDSFSPGSLTIFASSRPHRFRSLLDTWLQQGRQLALVHGLDKVPHSLPANALAGRRRPVDLNQLSLDVSTTLCAPTPDPAALSPYLDRTLTTALALVCTTWPADSSSQPGCVALASSIGQHLSQLLGVYCLWDLPPWHESYEQPTAGESRVLPMHGCPLWNAGLACECASSTSHSQPHQCQACGQAHPLTRCPVNSFLPVPSETFAKRSDISLADRSAFMRWFGDVYALLKFHSSFRVWRMPLQEQLSRAQLLILPSGVLQPSPNSNSTDGLVPCDALVYIDWQNIKVPLYAVSSLMDGLRRFVLGDRPGVRGIRAIHVLLDRNKKSDIADALDKLAQTDGASVPIHVEHVEARKVQAIDSRLTLMLRTEPRPAVAGHHQADLVCVVSGDSDFSPDMSRLVLLGHRVLVVYNAQARPSFKQNALWEAGVDFMDLPELAAYRAIQLQRRLERKQAMHLSQQLGGTTRVSAMALRGGDLQSRLPGLSGACMDSEGHALLLTDELQNRIWRFVLLDILSNAALARLDMRKHNSREERQMIKDARNEVDAGTFRDLHMGSLELLVESTKKNVHFIVCIDNSGAMAPHWPRIMAAVETLKSRLRSSSSGTHSSDLVSVLLFNDFTEVLPAHPVSVGAFSLVRFPEMPVGGDSNFRSLLTHVQQLIAGRPAPLTELLFISEPTRVSDSSREMLAGLTQNDSGHNNSSLHCTVICPSSVMDPNKIDRQQAAHNFQKELEYATDGRADFIRPHNISPQPLNTAVEQFVAAATRRRPAHSQSSGELDSPLSAPKEVVVDRDSGLVFVCEGGGRIAVLDREANCMRTLLPAAATPSSPHPQRAPQARHLFLDSTRQRLWLTDLATQQMGYYDLRRRSVLDHSQMTAPYRVAKLEPALPSASRPASKCLAANGADLLFCDEGRRAFCLLTEIKQQTGTAPAATFHSTLLLDWTAPSSAALNSSAPLPSYHSLQLDRDGSYLFADATSHTIKRLVSLRDLDDDGDDDAGSSHWEVRLVAGKGQGGLANGDAREARFHFPATLVVDPSEAGSVFIVDQGNRLMRKLHVAHGSDAGVGGSWSSGSRSASAAHPMSRSLSDTARSRLKTRPCKPFQQGECRFQAESDKCGFLHECACCGGPHGERGCKHKQLRDQHPYLTFTGGDSSSGPSAIGHSKDFIYTCEICSVRCGPLDAAVQHMESESHTRKMTQSLHKAGRPPSLVTAPTDNTACWAGPHGSFNLSQITDSDDVDPAPNPLATMVHRGTPSPDGLSPVILTPVNHTANGFAMAGAFGGSRQDALSSVASTVSLSSSSTRSPSLADSGASAASSAATVFRCELCDMSFNSRSQMDQHEQGRMHRNRSARAAAGIPFSTPRCSSDSSPKRGEVQQDFRCHGCNQEFHTEASVGSDDDRRPRGLPCGHSVCARCLQKNTGETCPACAWPFESSKVVVNVHIIRSMQAHELEQAAAQRKREESARIMKEQHDAFQRAYPCMRQEQRSNKEPRYFCEPCQLIAGPLHRALAHANTNEHKAKLQQQQQQPLLKQFQGWSPGAGTWPQQEQPQLQLPPSHSASTSPQFAATSPSRHLPPHSLDGRHQDLSLAATLLQQQQPQPRPYFSSAGSSPPSSVFMGMPPHPHANRAGMQPQFAPAQLAATQLAATRSAVTNNQQQQQQQQQQQSPTFIAPSLFPSSATPPRARPVMIPADSSSPITLRYPDGRTFSGLDLARLDKRTHYSPEAKAAVSAARLEHPKYKSEGKLIKPPSKSSRSSGSGARSSSSRRGTVDG